MWIVGLIIAVGGIILIGGVGVLIARHRQSRVARTLIKNSLYGDEHATNTSQKNQMIEVAPKQDLEPSSSARRDEVELPPVVRIHTAPDTTLPEVVDVAPEPEANDSAWKPASPSLKADSHRMHEELPAGHYLVSKNYYPKFADELELLVGDTVVVLDGSSEIWYIGFNVRTGKRGSFPKSVVTRDQRIVKPTAMATFTSEATSPPSQNVSPLRAHQQSRLVTPPKEDSPRLVHSRMDSSHDILIAQQNRTLPEFVRGPSSPSSASSSEHLTPTAARMASIKHTSSVMDRQLSRK